jgi:hypothetical protein
MLRIAFMFSVSKTRVVPSKVHAGLMTCFTLILLKSKNYTLMPELIQLIIRVAFDIETNLLVFKSSPPIFPSNLR